MNGNSALAASSFLTNDRDDFHTIPLSDSCNRLVSSRLDSLTLSPYHGKFSVSVASWSGASVSAWDSELFQRGRGAPLCAPASSQTVVSMYDPRPRTALSRSSRQILLTMAGGRTSILLEGLC